MRTEDRMSRVLMGASATAATASETYCNDGFRVKGLGIGVVIIENLGANMVKRCVDMEY